MQNSFSYFQNSDCKYYPCHKAEDGYFNCLFCYCPLYALGDKCGGSFSYTEKGIKNCTDCRIPHSRGGYEHIQENIHKLTELAKNKENP